MARKTQGVKNQKQRKPRTGSAYVGVGPHFGRVGPLIDITMDGLTFCYKARKKQPDGLSLDIFLTDRDFYLSYVPFRTVSDTKIPQSLSESTSTRKCTVQFGNLTPTQMSGLQDLIQSHTSGRV
ncbi:MAG: hypothetical protein JRF69_12445 [Deltaproteobacteria bacterium]|nr:hypothetical protein [Deltaproteobacteria bacterium]